MGALFFELGKDSKTLGGFLGFLVGGLSAVYWDAFFENYSDDKKSAGLQIICSCLGGIVLGYYGFLQAGITGAICFGIVGGPWIWWVLYLLSHILLWVFTAGLLWVIFIGVPYGIYLLLTKYWGK